MEQKNVHYPASYIYSEETSTSTLIVWWALTKPMDLSTTPSRQQAIDGEPELGPLEQEVLDEYAKLVGNLDNVSSPSLLFTLGILLTQ